MRISFWGKMKKKSGSGSKGVPPPPSDFDGTQESFWSLPLWRSTFLTQRSNIKKALFFSWVKVNGTAITIAIVAALLLHYAFPHFSIAGDSLSILGIGILSASIAILTIIVPFLMFWFGSAKDNMRRTRDKIRDELRNLQLIKRDVSLLTAGPKESVSGDLKVRAGNLAKKSDTFFKALSRLDGRFSRADLGTYYDAVELAGLHLSIQATGGEWFVAYAGLFRTHTGHSFGRKTWENAMDSSGRLLILNDEASRARNQIMQLINFMPTLNSILFVFLVSLLIVFMSSTGSLQPLVGLILSFILVILLSVHLGSIVRFLWRMVSLEFFTYETNRLLDVNRSHNIEQRHPVDDEDAITNYIKGLVDAFADKERDTNLK